MNNSLSDLAQRLGLPSSGAVVSKAGELLRLLDIRQPKPAANTRICRPIICVDIACSLLGIALDRKAAIKQSAVSAKVYTDTLQRLRAVLSEETRKTITFKQLAVQFGCLTVTAACDRLTLAVVHQQQQQGHQDGESLDVEASPVYVAAIFAVVCKTLKVTIKKRQLLESCGVSEAHFDKIAASIVDECKVALENINKPTALTTASKRSTSSAKAAEVQKPAAAVMRIVLKPKDHGEEEKEKEKDDEEEEEDEDEAEDEVKKEDADNVRIAGPLAQQHHSPRKAASPKKSDPSKGGASRSLFGGTDEPRQHFTRRRKYQEDAGSVDELASASSLSPSAATANATATSATVKRPRMEEIMEAQEANAVAEYNTWRSNLLADMDAWDAEQERSASPPSSWSQSSRKGNRTQ